jgi:serine/threonine protein kinase
MPDDVFGLVDQVIDGQFRALEVAGAGGFGVVYRGQHLTLREPIAIKCLKLKLQNATPAVVASFTQRFFDESRIMYRLSQGNLNIVRAITTGVTKAPATGETVPYMVLEWLEGDSLAKELKARRANKAPPPSLEEILAMFEPAALGIAYAHEQGVVHRDVKPGNLFLQNTREGRRMKVLDFGMAKVLSPESMGGLESAETLAGITVVSPQYVTPEQVDKSLGTVGPWTDVYAFALILVEALTNRRARDAETLVDLLRQIAKRDGAPTPRRRGADVSEAVDAVFERALAGDPKARQPNMGTFWRELVAAAKQPRAEAPRFDQTTIDIQPPPGSFGGTRLMAAQQAQQAQPARPNMSQTMRLDQSPVAPMAAKRPFSGTMPMHATPDLTPAAPPAPAPAPSAPAMAPKAPVSHPALAAVAPPPQAWTPPQVAQAPPQMAPAPMPAPSSPRVSAPLPLPAPSAPVPSRPAASPKSVAPRANRALVAALLLFALASLGASGFLLAQLYFHR